MQVRQRITLTIAAAALYAGSMLLVAIDARAHGDAMWIQEGGYTDAFGTQCCGPTDCRREKAERFQETPAGILYSPAVGRPVLMPRSLVGHGLYPSIDGDWWVCAWGGAAANCIFKPTTGG